MSIELVERAQRGDRDAYERLARDAAPRLYLIASRVLRDPDAADDAVQQTLVAIWRDLASLRDPSRFDGWAYRMVVRYCRAEARRRRRMGVHIVDPSESLAADRDDYAQVAMHDELRRAFDGLSQEHRIVVVLHHLIGLPIGDIAEILDIPYGTVGSRLHHAIRLMRATIDAAGRPTVAGGQPA
jgi:RNA polymerase sigma-70 factor (ECF subfamily)